MIGSDITQAVALATKISIKAEETLAGVDREMLIMKWPNEFRAVMWEAIADMASIRAKDARSQTKTPPAS